MEEANQSLEELRAEVASKENQLQEVNKDGQQSLGLLKTQHREMTAELGVC